MHASELIKIAAWIAFDSPRLFAEGDQSTLVERLSAGFWSASKCRGQLWHVDLRKLECDTAGLNEDDVKVFYPHEELAAVGQEIICSDLLTRIWAAAVAHYESMSGSTDLYLITDGIVKMQYEARRRFGRILASAPDTEATQNLKKLINNIDNWTDLLLSQFAKVDRVRPFAICQERLIRFQQARTSVDKAVYDRAAKMLRAKIHSELRKSVSTPALNPSLNQKALDGILACFGAQEQQTQSA